MTELHLSSRSNQWPSECLPRMKCTPQQCGTQSWSYHGTFSVPLRALSNIHICTILQYLPPPIDINLPSTNPVEPTSGHWVVLDFLKFVLAWRSTMRIIRWQNRSSDGINDVDYDDMRWKLCNQLRIPTRGSTLHCIPMHSNAMQCNAMELL